MYVYSYIYNLDFWMYELDFFLWFHKKHHFAVALQ